MLFRSCGWQIASGEICQPFVNNVPIDDMRVQKVLSALIVTVCFILVYGLCRCFLAPLSSIIQERQCFLS